MEVAVRAVAKAAVAKAEAALVEVTKAEAEAALVEVAKAEAAVVASTRRCSRMGSQCSTSSRCYHRSSGQHSP